MATGNAGMLFPGTVFVAAFFCVFEFQRGVLYAEVFQSVFDPVFQIGKGSACRSHHMRRKGVFRGAERPDMQMVYIADPRNPGHFAANGFRIHA